MRNWPYKYETVSLPWSVFKSLDSVLHALCLYFPWQFLKKFRHWKWCRGRTWMVHFISLLEKLYTNITRVYKYWEMDWFSVYIFNSFFNIIIYWSYYQPFGWKPFRHLKHKLRFQLLSSLRLGENIRVCNCFTVSTQIKIFILNYEVKT